MHVYKIISLNMGFLNFYLLFTFAWSIFVFMWPFDWKSDISDKPLNRLSHDIVTWDVDCYVLTAYC